MRKTLSALAIALLLFAVGLAPAGGEGAAAPDSRRDPEIAAFVADDAPQYVELVSSSSEEVVLDVHVDEFNARDVEVEGTVYQRLSLPGAGRTLEVGRPELPVIGQFVAVPQGAEVEIEVQDLEQSMQMGYRVFPAQPPLVDCARPQDEVPPFEIDQEAYGQDQFFPQQYVAASAPQTLRNLDVVWLSIHPLQFNPARGELRFNRTMRIRLTFTGGADVFPAEGRPGVDSAFRPMCEAFVINCDSVAPPLSAEGYPPDGNGAEFLIITAPEYAEAADALADWKNERGISTRVVTTSETGVTASAIKSYIENAFHSWTPQPAYVLLLGDADEDQIPVHYVNDHPSGSSGKTGTDLYYGTMGGPDDVLPDIHLGRIPVDTLDQANHVVDKIIAYETNPPADPSFYTNAVVAAEFQDTDNYDGYEDRLFVWTSEQIRDHLVSEGYGVERIYYTHGDIDPHHYNDGWPPYGEPLPGELRKPGFAWDGNNQDILDALNAGAFVISHRDHGWVGGWAAPSFNLSDIDSLTNGAETPVVFSINCETGRFDSETDANEWTTDDPGFAEKFLLHQDTNPGQGGAVGIFAATRVSYSWYNDYLVQGFYDSIWPTFLSYSALPPSPRMGNTLTHGKYYYASIFGTDAFITLELFHYLGDPTMEIWTGVPSNLSVSHAEVADVDAGSFTVNVAQDGALVAISQEGQLLGTATAVGGSATVPLDIPFEGGPANVTVTKHNHRPYRGIINVRPVVEFPFYDGFEEGSLDERWMFDVSDSEARVRVGDTYAYDGARSLQLDDRVDNFTYSTSFAELTIDLSGESDVLLDFWWREFLDEDHDQDGVFISDDEGDTWHRVFSFNGDYGADWQHKIVDIDGAAAAHGLTLNDRFRIRFQSYDNYPIPSDGYAIDDVCVRPEVIVPLWRESMERGLYGWNASELWHRIEENTSSHPETHSPTHSWWYGLEATGNYSTGEAISGTLTSPPISIPASAPEPALQFWSWYETETSSTTYDIRRVEISTDGETFPAGEQLWGEPMRSWQHHEIDLIDYVGNTIWVRFHFDTVDSYYNDYRGWYIDDVVVQLADPVYLPLILRNSN